MTEQEWMESSAKGKLYLLQGTGSRRKLRLFSCACSRSTIWDLLVDMRSRHAVEVAERFADGAASANELEASFLEAQGVTSNRLPDGASYQRLQILQAEAAELAAMTACRDLFASVFHWAAAWWTKEIFAERKTAEREHQCHLLYCIFGNPFRTMTLDPAWLTPTVKTLAEQIYIERAFDRLPILADALEDAGCTNPDMLGHCRGQGPHTRGSFVIDLLLGKE